MTTGSVANIGTCECKRTSLSIFSRRAPRAIRAFSTRGRQDAETPRETGLRCGGRMPHTGRSGPFALRSGRARASSGLPSARARRSGSCRWGLGCPARGREGALPLGGMVSRCSIVRSWRLDPFGASTVPRAPVKIALRRKATPRLAANRRSPTPAPALLSPSRVIPGWPAR